MLSNPLPFSVGFSKNYRKEYDNTFVLNKETSVIIWISTHLFKRILSSWEFLLWLSGLRTQRSLCEDDAWPCQGSDIAASCQVADVARIQCCYGCGVGLKLQLPFNP